MIKELGTLTFDFLPFERVQLEEYLNTLYEKEEHFQNTNKGFEIVKTHTRYYYKVTLFSNNEIEEEKMIQSYKQFGYEYIGKFRNFGIFESTENHIISINEMAENEIITKLIKKDIHLNL